MTDGQSISIVLNGERHATPAAMGLVAFIESLGLPVQGVLVEYNGTALLRDEWPEVRLANDDRLEILRVVAGG